MVGIALLFVVGSVFLFTKVSVLHATQVTSEAAAASKITEARDLEAIAAETAPLDASTASQQSPVDTTPSSNPSGAPQNSPACTMITTELVKKYHAAARREKRTLDDRIGLPMGSNIVIALIEEYNATIKRLFDKAVQDAQIANCTFPIDSPSYLPLSYPN